MILLQKGTVLQQPYLMVHAGNFISTVEKDQPS